MPRSACPRCWMESGRSLGPLLSYPRGRTQSRPRRGAGAAAPLCRSGSARPKPAASADRGLHPRVARAPCSTYRERLRGPDCLQADGLVAFEGRFAAPLRFPHHGTLCRFLSPAKRPSMRLFRLLVVASLLSPALALAGENYAFLVGVS